MKLLPNLTGLRFVLAFLVVIYHIPHFSENRGFPSFNDYAIFKKGQEAVYMFFTLSGFLIIQQLYLEKSDTQSINLKNFFLRRIFRIFPLYYLVLTFGFLYYRIILPHLGFEVDNNYNLFHALLLSYTFFPNIFAAGDAGGIIEVLWSIGIEEQFYLFIAPIFFLIPFKRVITFLLVFTACYFLIYFSGFADFMKTYKMLFFYFSFSGICSIVFVSEKINFGKLRYLIFSLFIIYFTTSLFKDNLNDLFYHLFSMILFGLTIYGLAEQPIRILENKSIVYLGKISYGIYMYHAILMQVAGFIYLKTNIHTKIPGVYSILLFNAMVIGFTIITSHISYKYFESYFLKMKHKYKKNSFDSTLSN